MDARGDVPDAASQRSTGRSTEVHVADILIVDDDSDSSALPKPCSVDAILAIITQALSERCAPQRGERA